MGAIGTKVKRNSLKQQRINAELECIIEEFAHAMRSANMEFIAEDHGFTPRQQAIGRKYVIFAQKYYGKKA